MKKYLEKNKGVLMFYLIVALLAVVSSYRFNRLNEVNNSKIDNKDIVLLDK